MAKARKDKPAAPLTNAVTLALLDRETNAISEIPLKALNLQSAALKWKRIAANRAKWEDVPSEVTSVQEDASRLLRSLGVGEPELRRLAQAIVIEVAITWRKEEEGWEYRILPWEFVLVRAMRPFVSATRSPVIARHLRREPSRAKLPALSPVKRVLGVLSCPSTNELRPAFEKEMNLVAGYFSESDGAVFERLTGATRESLERAIKEGADIDAIHFLGIEWTGSNPNRSYVWLQSTEKKKNECEYEDTAEILTANGAKHPRLVAFSFCHTGPRLAAFTVADGAHAAIGFQDVVTNEQCESFFGCFYRVWRAANWNVLAAFETALHEVASTLRGAGIILWLDRSLLPTLIPSATPAMTPAAGAAASATPAAVVPPAGLEGVVPLPSRVVATDPRKFLVVTIEPRPSINYAVLHNQQVNGPAAARKTLFKSFCLQRQPSAPEALEVDVEVNLYAGDHVGSWRERLPLALTTTDLADKVHVPLTSVLARSLRESLRTTIETKVRIGDVTVDHRSHPVSLLAIEEWLDDGICHIWLPSFVLPRDPAVSNIVNRARRSLCALLDDYTAGFDGYQSGMPERVDCQVKAIWATLSLDWQLGYLNPPPAFTARSQRLRRPSDVLEGTAGTCVDLALLLAACLEYIDIHPVIILAPNHAYVGWWRQEGQRLSYTQDVMREDPNEANGARQELHPQKPNQSPESERQASPWTMGKEAHAAISRSAEEGRLAVIETTGLTRHLPFGKALHEGRKRLRSRLDFECLIDVRMARTYDITPLPMCL